MRYFFLSGRNPCDKPRSGTFDLTRINSTARCTELQYFASVVYQDTKLTQAIRAISSRSGNPALLFFLTKFAEKQKVYNFDCFLQVLPSKLSLTNNNKLIQVIIVIKKTNVY